MHMYMDTRKKKKLMYVFWYLYVCISADFNAYACIYMYVHIYICVYIFVYMYNICIDLCIYDVYIHVACRNRLIV